MESFAFLAKMGPASSDLVHVERCRKLAQSDGKLLESSSGHIRRSPFDSVGDHRNLGRILRGDSLVQFIKVRVKLTFERFDNSQCELPIPHAPLKQIIMIEHVDRLDFINQVHPLALISFIGI